MKHKIYSIILLFTLFNFQLFGQECIVEEESNEYYPVDINRKPEIKEKYLKLNFHIFLKRDGSGNFNELDDGLGNNFTGYDFVNTLLDYVNSEERAIPLNIPPNNNLGANNKKIKFIANAVYFHRNNEYYTYNPEEHSNNYSVHNHYAEDPLNVLNVYYRVNDATSGHGGAASNTSQTYISNKYTNIRFPYWRYTCIKTGSNQVNDIPCIAGDQLSWNFSMKTLGHEVMHLLGLNHTVRTSGGNPAAPLLPVLPPPLPSDVDNIDDTPSPWEMFYVYGSNHHPACGWNTGNESGCSNNWMDYNNGSALSPGQIEKMHIGLNNALNVFTICPDLEINKDITYIGYPRVSYYGKQITIGGSSFIPSLGYDIKVNSNEQANIYYSDEVNLLTGFEAELGSKLEILPVECS